MATAVERNLRSGNLGGIPLPAVLCTPAPFTDAELLAFSARNSPYRIERNTRGELEIMTPVGGQGSRWESYAVREMDLWTDLNGGVSFSSAGGFSLPDGSMLSPDTAWISQGRWDALTEEQQSSFPPLCPEFVVEVLSASDSRSALHLKMGVWMANGAQLAWLIDPRAGEVTIYRQGKAPELQERPERINGEGPVAGFFLRTSRFWR